MTHQIIFLDEILYFEEASQINPEASQITPETLGEFSVRVSFGILA
jgi:hypothetical protein